MNRRRNFSYYIISAALLLLGLITLYPILYVFSMSISDPVAAYTGRVTVLPSGFSLRAYQLVLENKQIWTSYGNTIFYTVAGTAINILLTVLGAYVLSQNHYVFRKPLTLIIMFTMFFSGGLIPSYILVNNLHLYNTRWALLLPGAISTFNLLIAINYFRTVPGEIYEAARIDGANDLQILFRIVIFLVKPVLATLVLFYAVSHWNSYFPALLYLATPKLQPMQLYLMKVLVMGDQSLAGGLDTGSDRVMILSQLKYAAIMITMLPIMMIYPFLQKHFVKGVMLGSIKA